MKPRSRRLFTALSTLGVLASSSLAQAAPVLRFQTNQKGDFVLFGSSLAYDCGGPAPVVGTVQGCPTGQPDSPDMYWRSDDPQPGQARANTNISALNARTTAVLQVPPGATITKAYLYWSGAGVGNNNADTTVTLERPNVFTQNLTAGTSYTSAAQGGSYMGVVEVTSLLQTHGAGAYRVTGVNSNLINQDDRWSGWWMVVLYQNNADPERNLAVFDAFDFLDAGNPSTSTSRASRRLPPSPRRRWAWSPSRGTGNPTGIASSSTHPWFPLPTERPSRTPSTRRITSSTPRAPSWGLRSLSSVICPRPAVNPRARRWTWTSLTSPPRWRPSPPPRRSTRAPRGTW